VELATHTERPDCESTLNLLLDGTSGDGFWQGFSLADSLEGAPRLGQAGTDRNRIRVTSW
jgi:hypothetical protein